MTSQLTQHHDLYSIQISVQMSSNIEDAEKQQKWNIETICYVTDTKIALKLISKCLSAVFITSPNGRTVAGQQLD